MSENDKSTMTRAELHKNDNLAREPKKTSFSEKHIDCVDFAADWLWYICGLYIL